MSRYTSGTNQPPNSNVDISFNQGGTYTATVTAWNSDRTLSSTRTIQINALPGPVISQAQWTPPQIQPGESSTLSWVVQNATLVNFSVPGGSPASGSATNSVSVTFPQSGIGRATITATGQPGTIPAVAYANVTVAPLAPSVTSISWSPGFIRAPGSSTLSWTTTNATSVNLSIPGGNPSVLNGQPPSGSAQISFSSGGNYTGTVTAFNQGVTGTRSASLSVASEPQITGGFTGPVLVPQTNQDQVTLTLLGPDAGTYNYTVSGQPGVSFDTATGNPAAGTFTWIDTGNGGNRQAVINLSTPHPTTTLTATISRSGYTSYSQSLVVPQRLAPIIVRISVVNETANTNKDKIRESWLQYQNTVQRTGDQFFILKPQYAKTVYVPPEFNSNPSAFGPIAVNEDNNNPAKASDWFAICGLASVPAGSQVLYWIDPSGSLGTNAVRASLNLFLSKCSSAGIPTTQLLRQKPDQPENWAGPFV